ncbi:hypothetical protein [Benzoatithermus flavus]|uniref:Uncharacterized protein n=1 Tax=Benzoatithermus flavus TaxID=3108223 RepID=A0ABU8XN84_9PROT
MTVYAVIVAAMYLNTALGLVVGSAVGVLMFRLLRPLGVGWTVRRLAVGPLPDGMRLTSGMTGTVVVEPKEERKGA